jgi:hypothetical protein
MTYDEIMEQIEAIPIGARVPRKVRAIKELRNPIAEITDVIQRDLLIVCLANALGIDVRVVRSEINLGLYFKRRGVMRP